MNTNISSIGFAKSLELTISVVIGRISVFYKTLGGVGQCKGFLLFFVSR